MSSQRIGDDDDISSLRLFPLGLELDDLDFDILPEMDAWIQLGLYFGHAMAADVNICLVYVIATLIIPAEFAICQLPLA